MLDRSVLSRAPRALLLALAVACLAVTLAACGSTQTVSHLDMRPWALNTPQSVSLKFWRFEYVLEPDAGAYVARGAAYPRETIPGFFEWAEDLWFAAYLADAQGNVIASAGDAVLPQRLAPGRGIPVAFRLDPKRQADGPLFVAFGYRMRLTEWSGAVPWGPGSGAAGANPLTSERDVFFASEGALTKF